MFVDRARVIGSGNGRIMRRHILPNVVNLVVAQSVLTFAAAVFTETTLVVHRARRSSTAPSWGQLLDNAQSAGAPGLGAWWFIAPPARGGRARGPVVHARRQRARRRPQSALRSRAMTEPRADGARRHERKPVDAASIRGRRQWPMPKLAVPERAAARGPGPRGRSSAGRLAGSGRSTGSASDSTPARRSASSASRAAARPRQRSLDAPAAAQRPDPRRARSSSSGSTSVPKTETQLRRATAGARSPSSSRAR